MEPSNVRIEKHIGNSPIKRTPQNYFTPGSENWFVLPEGTDKGQRRERSSFTTTLL